MRIRLIIVGTAVVTAFVSSAFWIWAFKAAHPSDKREGGIVATGSDTALRASGANSAGMAKRVTIGPGGLAIPVAGLGFESLSNSFTQARAGGARDHDAIDILAAAGTPVVAAAPGRIEKLFYSAGGDGVTIYVRSDDSRWSYYYAHLQRYAPGLAEGQRVQRGQVIGYVGTSGNASSRGPHLHFAINRMSAGEKWWQGTPANPYPLLTQQGQR